MTHDAETRLDHLLAGTDSTQYRSDLVKGRPSKARQNPEDNMTIFTEETDQAQFHTSRAIERARTAQDLADKGLVTLAGEARADAAGHRRTAREHRIKATVSKYRIRSNS